MCGNDEVSGEVQGESALICAAKCKDVTFECPSDVPLGTTAEPQCMLQDVNAGFHCGLVCQLDTQCPSGHACRAAGSLSICMRPLSFAEWSDNSKRQKLNVAWPTGAGGHTKPGFQIAKAYAALQSLKKKYGIGDGDADVLTVKELLMSAHGSTAAQAAAAQLASSGAAASSRGGLFGSLAGDFNHLTHNLQDGLPGIEHELVRDTEWNIEHGRYWAILRGFLAWVAAYLVLGSAYKYQTAGARGMDMIPHIGFWIEYPNLVRDGVGYISMLISGFFGGESSSKGASASSSGFQTIGRARDSFSSSAMEQSL